MYFIKIRSKHKENLYPKLTNHKLKIFLSIALIFKKPFFIFFRNNLLNLLNCRSTVNLLC